MSSSTSTSPPSTTSIEPRPRRFIFNDVDMAKFQDSAARKQLLQLTNAMGKSCASETAYRFDPQQPLVGLSPSLAALHGSLRSMLTWLEEFPPVDRSKARFGNPSFRKWHERLVERSVSIIYNILEVHGEHPGSVTASQEDDNSSDSDMALLQKCSDQGYEAATKTKTIESITDEKDRMVVIELAAYLQSAFGHPMRLDFGTGHESSFQVFLFTLCRLGCFGSTPTVTADEPPTPERLKAVTLSIYQQYLQVTRQLQTDYMLEPAGSHGVWGLDDYHCLPFYFGACQLQAEGEMEGFTTDSINDDSILERYGDRFMYFGCIRYIKFLKKGVPFFESSPMLHDISQLAGWQKVASGLFRLYEGEVLNKRQVVQHFVFGNIFSADWIASGQEKEAPTATFRHNQAVGPMARAPWADDPKPEGTGPLPPTKAPWAK
jgi:serine/threonine-protein phosphatase 2A activator